LGHISLTRKIVSEMTYIVSSGTLNPTIPYYTIPRNQLRCISFQSPDELPGRLFKLLANSNRNISIKILKCAHGQQDALRARRS